MSSFEKRTLKGTLLGFVSFFVNIIYSIVLVPFFLTYWGEAKYGQFLGIFAFIQLLRTLDNGHQIFIGNKFNLYYHNDKEKAYKTLSSSTLIAFCIGFLEFLLFVILWISGFGERVLGLQIRLDDALVIGISCMLVMWWLVGSVGGILVKAVLAKGLFSEATLFAILIKIVEIVIIGLAIVLKLSLPSLFVSLALINFVFSLLVLYWVYQKMPEFFPWWKGWDFKTGISNLGNSMVITINGFLEQLNSSGLIFIVSHYLSVALIPVFTTLRTLTNTMNMVTNIFIQPLIPEMVRFHSQADKVKVLRILQTNWFFSGLLVNLGFIILLPVADYLYRFWTNDRLLFNENLFYLLILSVILHNYGKGMISYLSGINDLRSISIISWTKSSILFLVTIMMIKTHGINSIGWGVLFSELVGSVVLTNIFTIYHLKNEMKFERPLWIYSIPVLAMIGILLLFYLCTEYKIIIAVFGFLILMTIYGKQWLMLDPNIKRRIIGLASVYKEKYLNH